MARALSVLLIEDREERAEEIARALRDHDFDPHITRAGTLAGTRDALCEGDFDVVICEHQPGTIQAEDALQALGECTTDLPLLVISDGIEVLDAVGGIRAGAYDWIKGHDIDQRLGPTVARALREADTRGRHAEAMRRLEDSEGRYRELAEALPQVVFEIDEDGHFIFANRRGLEVFGYTEEDVASRIHVSQLLVEEDAERAMQTVRRVVHGETLDTGDEYTAIRKDGTRVPVMVHAAPIMRQGRPAGLRGVLMDLTDIKRVQERLRASEHRYRSLVDTMSDGLVLIDRRGIITFANQALANITGFTLDQVIGSNARELLDEDNIAILEEQLRQRFSGERLGPTSYELEMVVQSGARTPLLITSTALRDEDGEVIGSLGVVTDMTEQQRTQEQLRRSQRMEAIGTLAGGIAHDFNNVLTAIIGHADLLSAEAEDGSSTEWHAVQIGEAAERAASLTRQLLAFSRRQPARPQVLDLNRIAGGMEEIFRRLIPEDIELRFDLASDLGYTQIDPAQVEQLVMNLVVNARDAMLDGGVLAIATRNATLADDDMTELFDARPGNYITLTVSDTGIGMDEETEARVFEPFFTTKANTGGSGLGLSTVYGIVRQHDGTITVYSEPGEGSIFRIYLPRTDRPAASASRAAAGDREALRGSELLLIVEDAENLRTLVQTMLGTLGYTVLSAGGGPEAIELAAAHAGEIDMLVTDVVMPEMSGTELAELLIVDNPQMHVLYVSGYPSERALDAERTDARFSFLQKPFSAVELGRRLREILAPDLPDA